MAAPGARPVLRRRVGAVITVGLIYVVAGVVSGSLAGAAATIPMRTFWRAAAFVVSGIAFAAHLWLERLTWRSPARAAALRAALAVALGAFLLAFAALLHDTTGSVRHRNLLILSLVLWPLITAVPAFLAGLVAASLVPSKETNR